MYSMYVPCGRDRQMRNSSREVKTARPKLGRCALYRQLGTSMFEGSKGELKEAN